MPEAGKTIRIANGQGYWGDWLEAPVHLVERGPIDYLTLDYLAEITMSIMQKMRARDPNAGYARDFLTVVARVLPKCLANNIKIVANAGGVNPQACVAGLAEVVKKLGLSGQVTVGVVAGDDIMDRLDEFIAKDIPLENMETGEPLSTIRDRVASANVYFGAAPIADALAAGAQIIVTGRCTDTGLTLGPLIHEFGWATSGDQADWDRLSAGTIAGHIIECGAQTTGGNCQVDWQTIPDFWNIGYPIVEANADGSFVVTKHANTGGRITVAGVTEQLMYEMGDPKNYITPDCVADFTSVNLTPDGENRVRVSGIKGNPATDFYKVSISFADGFKAAGGLIYAWPDAYAKAKVADATLRRRLDSIGLKFDEMLSQFIGVNATHEGLGGEPSPDIAEVMLRVGVRSKDKAAVDRFTKEIAPLALSGPPTVTGFGGGRPKVEEVIAYWPALIPKSAVAPKVEVITV